MNFTKYIVTALILDLYVPAVHAALYSEVRVGAGNAPYVGDTYGERAETFDSSQVVAGPYSKSYYGNDSNWRPGVTTFAGQAASKSDYGFLSTSASATLANPIDNPQNPIYYNAVSGEVNPSGMPDSYQARSHAFFGDAIAFTGSVVPEFIQFDITLSGSLLTAGINPLDYTGTSSLIYLQQGTSESLQPFGALSSVFAKVIRQPSLDLTDFSFTLKSRLIPVVGGVARFGFYLDSAVTFMDVIEDGVTRSGAVGDVAATITGVHAFDGGAKPLNNLAFLSASGTDYAAIPEPATYALCLGVGAIGLSLGLRRYRGRSESVATRN